MNKHEYPHYYGNAIYNKSLCGKMKVGTEMMGECANFANIIHLEEKLNEERCCKKCLKILNNNMYTQIEQRHRQIDMLFFQN